MHLKLFHDLFKVEKINNLCVVSSLVKQSSVRFKNYFLGEANIDRQLSHINIHCIPLPHAYRYVIYDK